MNNAADSVESIAPHLERYLETAGMLTRQLDRENQLLLFTAGEANILNDAKQQEEKRALYTRMKTLARIVTGTLRSGSEDDVTTLRTALVPIEGFRSSLRLNSALLEASIERQERHLNSLQDKPLTALEDANVADRSI